MLKMCYFQIKNNYMQNVWKLVYLIKFYNNNLLQDSPFIYILLI